MKEGRRPFLAPHAVGFRDRVPFYAAWLPGMPAQGASDRPWHLNGGQRGSNASEALRNKASDLLDPLEILIPVDSTSKRPLFMAFQMISDAFESMPMLWRHVSCISKAAQISPPHPKLGRDHSQRFKTAGNRELFSRYFRAL